MTSPVSLLSANMPILLGVGAVVVCVAGFFAFRAMRSARSRRIEQQLRDEVAQGKYFRALQYYMEQGRYEDAAGVEEAKGNKDKAGRLYERAGNLEKAGRMYVESGDYGMAALFFRDAGMKEKAAEAFALDSRFDAAAELSEEIGDWRKAAEYWRENGDLERAREALLKAGEGDEAARTFAAWAEQAGELRSAARHWEEAGERARAMEIYKRLGEMGEVARLHEEGGEVLEAASLRMRNNDFAGAARAYQKAGRAKEAAHAYFRAGNLEAAVKLLESAGEWLSIAKLFMTHNRSDQARAALMRVPPESPQYREALQMLVALEERAERFQEAYRIYEALVRHAVEDKKLDGQTRQWVLGMARILLRADRRADAVRMIKRLQPLGLLRPEDSELVRRLEHASQAGPGTTNQFRALSQVLGVPRTERYEFKKQLAQGGNGVIFLAYDKTLDREIVIKLIRQTALPTETAIQWFIREARTAAKLQHPNIVTIYDLGDMDGQPFIAMEFVDGETLVDLVERTELPMAPERIVEIYEPLCNALNYAHEAGFVHRDIKLENVMITKSGEVKLMDFGLAQAMHGPGDEEMITGTPLYMSPEQIEGKEVDSRADIYSLGVMLFLLACGQWPYERDGILHAHRFDPIPDPRIHNPELPDAFEAVITRCMQKSPEDRFARATEVAKGLKEGL